ncbi:hypothetical protein [Thermotoga sp. KOL6]|uniref:hypothetical protein n=1 Tax=Thermotoga sp. KOL6 TaxID=126741 RepID=UPI0018EAEB54|nr:hypothetical protein [Thermotoga sp. KOL6]
MNEVPQTPIDLAAVIVPPQEILKDISLLCLGSSGNLNFSKDAGIAVGKILKEKNVSYYVFGTFDVLKVGDSDPLSKVSSSPYITAQVLSLFAEGLSIVGVVPVFNATGNIDTQVVTALVTRNATYPVMVENKEKYALLKRFGYTTSLVFDTDGNILVGRPIRFPWSYENDIDFERLRREILENSIVLINRDVGRISVNDPWDGGVLIFSDETWLKEIAKEVLSGKRSPTGRIP